MMPSALAGQDPDANNEPARWETACGSVAYPAALDRMDKEVAAIRQGAPGLVWLVEHPPLYTGGTSARAEDLLTHALPVYQTGRGGQYTYHGPGQRVAYVMIDLAPRGLDLKRYICDLETWLIAALAVFDVEAERREGRVGLWVDLSPYGRRGEAKIAAIGVRVRRWVTFHGIALNVNPDLSAFDGIVPCGISQHGVTSLADLGINASMDEVDAALMEAWGRVFHAL